MVSQKPGFRLPCSQPQSSAAVKETCFREPQNTFCATEQQVNSSRRSASFSFWGALQLGGVLVCRDFGAEASLAVWENCQETHAAALVAFLGWGELCTCVLTARKRSLTFLPRKPSRFSLRCLPATPRVCAVCRSVPKLLNSLLQRVFDGRHSGLASERRRLGKETRRLLESLPCSV